MAKDKTISKSNKISLTETAMEIRKKLTLLTNEVSLFGTVKDFEDFKKIKLLCEASYQITSPDGKIINEEYLSNYIKKLPDYIRELQTLKAESKKFLNEVKNRAPHAFKTGKFSPIMQTVVNPDAIKKLRDDAQNILNYCAINPLTNEMYFGANTIINYSKINERFVKGNFNKNSIKMYNKK